MQRELDLQGTRGVCPAGAEQLADPVQPLRDGIDVHVQRRRAPGGAAVVLEVRGQGRGQLGAAAGVVAQHLADRVVDEPPDRLALRLRQQQPGEAEVFRAGRLAGAAERMQRVQAAAGLPVGLGQSGRPAGRPGGTSGHLGPNRGMVLLLTNPEQRHALADDPSLIAGAVEEILRSSLPVPTTADQLAGGLPRYANTEIEFGGVTVAAGDLVLLGLNPANHDPQRFPDPERFDIGRAPNPHLSFGHGPRFCIGAPLARIEVHELFAALVHRCPDMRLAVPIGELRARDELLTGGLTALPVTWPASPGVTREL